MTKQNATEPAKRIPTGTRVKWQARYPSDPTNEGTVKKQPAKSPFGVPTYTVIRDMVNGRPVKPLEMHPHARGLEEQNPDSLKSVERP
jgi:hypothetical protein